MATDNPMRDIYDFKENRFVSLSHGIRVFIFGHDVTAWLRGSLTVTYGNRDSFNVCSFELANPHRIWQITPDNIPGAARRGDSGPIVEGSATTTTATYAPTHHRSTQSPLASPTSVTTTVSSGSWRDGGGEYSEAVKHSLYNLKTTEYLNPTFELDVKAVYLTTKQPDPGAINTPTNTQPSKYQERRYRMALGDCIFNKHDPVRVFAKNPYSFGEQWMEVFCGYINTHPITTNWLNGESNVRIDCYCIRQMMTKMRCATNIRAPNTPEAFVGTGFFQDFARYSQYVHPFSKSSLEATIRELVTGDPFTTQGTNASGGTIKNNTKGVGYFKSGNTVCFDPNKPGNTLERWYLMTQFGVHKFGFPSPGDDLWLSSEEVDKLGESTIPLPAGEDAIGGPDSRYLHFLLPVGGTGASDLVENTIDTPVPDYATWTTRWEIIRDFSTRLDFQVMTSPTGDILVEFPQYGFSPSAYGSASSARVASDVAQASTLMDKAGGLSGIMTFLNHHKEGTLNDEAEDFPTILTMEGGHAAHGNTGSPEDDAKPGTAAGARAYVYSPVLVSRYGAIAEVDNVPLAGQGIAADAKGIGPRLAKLGVLEFTRRMAHATALDTSIVFRPFLFPNRPVWFKRDYRIGVLNSVSHTWNIRQDATTTISIGMLMAERADGSFRLMTGSGNSPIDYRNVWGEQDKTVPTPQNSGIRTSVTDTPVKDSIVSNASNVVNITGPYKTLPAPAGLDSLYPPVAEKINRAISDWNKVHPDNPLRVTSAYRPPEKQAYLRRLYLEGKGLPANEPGRSFHEWGLAVDVTPASCEGRSASKADDVRAMFQQVADSVVRSTANDKDGPLVWKGSHDPVHFEINSNTWGFTLDQLRKSRADNAATMGANAYQAIWEQLNKTGLGLDFAARSPATNSTQAQTSAAPAPTAPTFSATPTACNEILDAVPDLTPVTAPVIQHF